MSVKGSLEVDRHDSSFRGFMKELETRVQPFNAYEESDDFSENDNSDDFDESTSESESEDDSEDENDVESVDPW